MFDQRRKRRSGRICAHSFGVTPRKRSPTASARWIPSGEPWIPVWEGTRGVDARAQSVHWARTKSTVELCLDPSLWRKKLLSASQRRPLEIPIWRGEWMNALIKVCDHLAESAALLDHHGRYLYLNRAAERMLGRSRYEVIGKSYLEVFPDSTEVPFQPAFERAVAAKGAERFE